MAIQVILYQMVKDKNSTKRPIGPGNPYTVELKDRCSVVDPVLIFNFGTQDYPSGFNYVNIPTFENRCYWITNWQYYGGLWQASCHVDALASWRADIGASEQYVVRAASDYDGTIIDSLYPLTTQVGQVEDNYDNPLTVSSMSDGAYVVGIINADTNQVVGGGVSYYCMTQTQFDAFRNYLLTNTDYLNISTEEISVGLAKTLFNPFQYIATVKWFPFVSLGESVPSVQFGWWFAPVQANRLATSYVMVHLPDMPLPSHPQASQRGNFCNADPATGRELQIEPFGTIPLDATRLKNYDTLGGFVGVDFITGKSKLVLTAKTGDGNSDTILCRYGQMSVDIQLSSLYTQMPSSGGELLSMGIKAILGGVGDAVQNVFGGRESSWVGVTNASQAATSTVEVKGSQGSVLSFLFQARISLISRFQLYADDDQVHRGRPLMAKRTVSSLSGFMTCDKPHVECHATADEIGEIENAMSSGFYWE